MDGWMNMGITCPEAESKKRLLAEAERTDLSSGDLHFCHYYDLGQITSSLFPHLHIENNIYPTYLTRVFCESVKTLWTYTSVPPSQASSTAPGPHSMLCLYELTDRSPFQEKGDEITQFSRSLGSRKDHWALCFPVLMSTFFKNSHRLSQTFQGLVP